MHHNNEINSNSRPRESNDPKLTDSNDTLERPKKLNTKRRYKVLVRGNRIYIEIEHFGQRNRGETEFAYI